MMQQGITAGAVLAVLLPVLFATLCFASYRRSKTRLASPHIYDVSRPASRPTRNPSSRPIISPPILTKDPNYSPVSRSEDPIIWKSGPPEQKLLHETPLGRSDYLSSSDSVDSSSSSVGSGSISGSFTYSNPASRLDPLGCRPVTIPKHFDGDYDTHEPVDNKPVIFQNVLWDLDDTLSKESSV